jgi:hypothetical protein
MYIYDRQPSGSPGQLITLRPAQRNPYYLDRTISGFLAREENNRYAWADQGLGQLSADAFSKKFLFLSFLPHFVEVNGKDVPLTPGAMDPGIYDGPQNYRIAPRLQDCLKAVMRMSKGKFRHIKVALVDLTKNVMQPEFAGSFDHKEPVFAASVPKIAPMLAAYQLRHDLRVALKQKAVKTLDDLFSRVREAWADTQRDPKGTVSTFTRGISLQGKVVLENGKKIPLDGPKVPRMESVFARVPAGKGVTIAFSSTGENKAKLKAIIKQFNQASDYLDEAQKKLKVEKEKKNPIGIADARKECKERLKNFDQEKVKINALGFVERMRVMIGGRVPASNYATATIVRDVGFPYIASTLLQSGLYNTNRNGGLWLSADYWGACWKHGGKCWSGPLGRGFLQSATAGSLAAFMTLLAQNRLVNPAASAEMRMLMKKEPNPTHPGIVSWFKEGLKQLPNKGSLKTMLSKLGVAAGGIDDCAYIEREVHDGKGGKKILRYVAVGLRAKTEDLLKELILELDKCILINNGLTLELGGHPRLVEFRQVFRGY